MHPDFRQLRNFVALVEYGSFNRAAEAVCLSQSAFRRWSRASAIRYSIARASYRRSPCTGKSCCPATAVRLIPTAIGEFHRLLPQARVRFQIDNWLALHQDLATTAGWRVPVRRLSGG